MISAPSLPAPHQILRILCLIRMIPLGGVFVGIYFLLQQNTQGLQWQFIFAVLVTLLLVIGVTWLHSFRAKVITDKEIFAHLSLDIALYSLLMFNTGGAANPFISYLLVPITIAAITLPATLTWLIGGLCLASYTILLFWFIPVPLISPGHSGHHGGTANVHLLGMWLNFVVSTGLIAFFVNKMARTLRTQQEALTRQREQRLEDDQLLAVATLAASAAHEMGTPLNSMKLICDDWHDELPESLRQEGKILNDQIVRCQHTLQKLTGMARSFNARGDDQVAVTEFFHNLVENWQVMRPDARVTCKITGEPISLLARFHPAITPCLHNLLNNAADASPDFVDIHVDWDHQKVRMQIEDRGSGVDINRLKQPLQESDKPTGMGLGLYLSHSILERHGATLQLEKRVEIGSRVTVILPLDRSAKT